ncbi:MAG: hopanoid-associated sugar epimerase [Acidobacteriaceae bacterium]
MRAFVTGATGFVGSHVAEQLAANGARLRLLVRPSSRMENLAGLNDFERVVGDLRDPESLKYGMRGCDAVFHVAADYRLWMKDPKEMYESNVEGTRAILRLAAEAGIHRVVHCSSVATMGFKADGRVVDEATPVNEAEMIGHYKRSKFLAEQVAIAAARSGQEVVIVNPTGPMGERDIKPTPTGRIIVDFLNGNFPAYMDTGMNLVDVREVAKAHVMAFEKARPGERYIIGGVNLTLKQILDKLSAITGIPSPKLRVPHAVAMAFAVLDETVTGKLRGKEPRATVESVRMGKKKMYSSSAKAERELGYEEKPVDAALRRAVKWFRANGYAPRRPANR